MVFLYPSIVIDTFVELYSLSWHLWYLRVCKISVQVLLPFRVSIEKLGTVTMGLALYVTQSFSLEAFQSFLHFVQLVFLLCHREFPFWSRLFGVCLLCLNKHLFL